MRRPERLKSPFGFAGEQRDAEIHRIFEFGGISGSIDKHPET